MNELEQAGAHKTNKKTKCPTPTAKSMRTRTKILEAAAQLIEERGSSDFQMIEIANLCNMSKGSLYYYFTDRDEIVSEVLSARLDGFVDSLEACLQKDLTPVESLGAVCEVFAESARSKDSIVALVASEMVQGGQSGADRAQVRFDRINELIEKEIVRGQNSGDFKKDVAAHFLSSCICGTFFFAAYGHVVNEGTVLDVKGFSQELLNLILHGIANV